MPIIKSAIKQLRKNLKAREKNRNQKDDVKKAIKTLDALVADKKIEESKKQLQVVYTQLDRLAKRNIVHNNKAGRKKSQMAKKVAHIK